MNLEQLLEYMRIHIISLDQDQQKLQAEMDMLDPASKDYGTLEFQFNLISGEIAGISYMLGVAEGKI